MRKAAVAIIAILVLIVGALLVVPRFMDVNRYHDRAQAEIQQRLGRPVTLGQMHLSLLPPKFRVENVKIAEDPSFAGENQQPFAAVEQLAVSVKLWPLLHKDVEISSLDLERPHIELVRNAQGNWNFSTLGKPQQPGAAQPSQAPPPQQPQQPSQHPQGQQPAPALQLDNLAIHDGQVALTDLQKHQSRAVYDHIDVALKNFAPDKQFNLSLAAHLPGKGTQTVSLNGTAGPLQQDNMLAMPFDGTLKLEQVSIDGVQKFLNTEALANMAGVISGSASVKNDKGALNSSGNLKIDNAVVHGVSIGYPISLDYKVADNLNTDVINISEGNVRLGSTPLAVSGTVNSRPSPAQVDLKVNAKDVSLAEAARLAAAFGVAFNADTKVDGRASADLSARGALNQPELNGSVSARNLAISGSDLPAPVQVPAIDLALTPQQVRSNQFTATAGNTALGMQFTLANYTSPSPGIDATVNTNNAQITNLLAIAKAYGVSAVNGMSGSGNLTLNVHAAGPVKNPDAMTFNGTGQIQNAVIKPPSLTQPLKVQNANLVFSNNGAQVQNLNATLGQTTATGNMTVRNFAAPNVQFTLTADKVNVGELQQITGGAPAQSPQAPRKQASLSLVPRAYAAPATAPAPSILQKMTGGGTVNIGTIVYDQLTLTNARANVTLNNGVIGMSPITAQLYDGLENGAITIDTRTTPMTVQVKSTLQRVQANPLISSVSSVKNTIYGLLASNAQANFRATGANDIARTLNGTLAIDLANGRITKLDLLNELAAVGKFAGVRKNAQAVTDVTRMTGHFNINNGVASTNDLKADIAGGSFAADGIVNLATQQLNMHVTAVLSKGMTQTVGGTAGVGGFMQTALANNRGELVIPVVITGTFDNPQVSPDVQKVAQMKLQNMLPTSGNPGALTSGILGNVLKGGNPAGGGGGGVAGAVLGALGGQKQQPAQPATSQQTQKPAASQNQQRSGALGQALQGILGSQNKQKNKPPQP